jgi:hypothetical protein
LSGKASVHVSRHDVLEPLAAAEQEQAALREQQPYDAGNSNVERLLYQHLAGAAQHLFHLFGAPGDPLGQRRHAPQNPQLRIAVVHVPQARPGAFAAHLDFIQLLRRRRRIRTARDRQPAAGQERQEHRGRNTRT